MSLFLLGQIVILLAASVLIISLSNKARVPPVVGFLLTGILIGPGGFSFVKDTETINVLAEIGVIMLLFMIGLEFTLTRLKRIRRNFWLGGGLQLLSTISVSTVAMRLIGIPLNEAVFYGCLVSLSSTAVVMTILAARAETDAPQGRISLGILIFQDIAIVPMIALVPVLANVGSVSPASIGLRFLLSAGVIVAAFLIARHLMPHLLRLVVATRIREVFLIASLVICLGMAWLTSSLGLSMALGAFLAGVVITESRYSHQVVSDILPFKDVFNSLFFISIGMLLNTGAVWSDRVIVVGLVVSILVLKTLTAGLTVAVLGYSARIALITGLGLAQVGEFSFVLAGVGRANGLLPGTAFQIFLASSILTILASPFLIQTAPALADRSGRALRWRGWIRDRGAETRVAFRDHVIIAGYGLNGRNLAYVLKEAGIPYALLELNPEAVSSALAKQEPIIFGDASSSTILREAGISSARGIVFAISDPATTRRGVRLVRELNPDAFIIVRTRFASEVDELYSLGADDVIPEEFETSLEIFSRVLDRFHVPHNIIDAQVRILRGECYGVLRGSCEIVQPPAERAADLLNVGSARTFYVLKGSWPAGRTLGDIGLRKRTGATVIAAVRGGESFTAPEAEFTVSAGDTLVLAGSHQDLDKASRYLASAGLEKPTAKGADFEPSSG
jgi:CPA2 family monovalent cation:H+ antiporter-2